GWMYHGNLAAQMANFFLLKSVPILWSIRHSLYDLKYEKRMTARVIRLCARFSYKPSKILYNAQVSARQHEDLGYCPEKTMVIPNGFDTNQFAPSREARIQIRNELGLEPGTPLIGLMARYHPMKDHENFFRAAASLFKTHPHVHFLLAGDNVDENNQTLFDLIKRIGNKERVHLLGPRMDVHKITAALDVATNSSFFGEAFSNAIGEAMSCGVPCVVTNVGDSAFLVRDTGRIVPPRDPDALAMAWKNLLDLGWEGRRKLGDKARQRIINHFSLDSVVAQYESLYSRILRS
ncbi:MAG: glycosyltransferase, partial [Nitrospinaceae bacterium]